MVPNQSLDIALLFVIYLKEFIKKRELSVGNNDGPLLRFYLKSASAVWDYILSQNSIKKILSTSCDFGLFVYKIYQWTVASNYRAANFYFSLTKTA